MLGKSIYENYAAWLVVCIHPDPETIEMKQTWVFVVLTLKFYRPSVDYRIEGMPNSLYKYCTNGTLLLVCVLHPRYFEAPQESNTLSLPIRGSENCKTAISDAFCERYSGYWKNPEVRHDWLAWSIYGTKTNLSPA